MFDICRKQHFQMLDQIDLLIEQYNLFNNCLVCNRTDEFWIPNDKKFKNSNLEWD